MTLVAHRAAVQPHGRLHAHLLAQLRLTPHYLWSHETLGLAICDLEELLLPIFECPLHLQVSEVHLCADIARKNSANHQVQPPGRQLCDSLQCVCREQGTAEARARGLCIRRAGDSSHISLHPTHINRFGHYQLAPLAAVTAARIRSSHPDEKAPGEVPWTSNLGKTQEETEEEAQKDSRSPDETL
jgi:hypothetical protein